LLYAEHRRSLLIVLQGMDAAGKDGTIKHVMSGVNPQGCSVTSFKQPGTLDLDHDSCGVSMPPSQHRNFRPFSVRRRADRACACACISAHLEKRYGEINDFERILTENGVCILKFFLHMSSKEQHRRFDERLADPRKNWKASPADFKEREYWDQYHSAYQDAIEKCGTKEARWYVIPSDHKWFRNFAVGEIIVRTLESFKMHYPRGDNNG
jgi:polyphosphate kinase 2 (PPK2 family)